MKYTIKPEQYSDAARKMIGVLEASKLDIRINEIVVVETSHPLVQELLESQGFTPLPETAEEAGLPEPRRRGPKPGTKYKTRKRVAEIANVDAHIGKDDGAGEAT